MAAVPPRTVIPRRVMAAAPAFFERPGHYPDVSVMQLNTRESSGIEEHATIGQPALQQVAWPVCSWKSSEVVGTSRGGLNA